MTRVPGAARRGRERPPARALLPARASQLALTPLLTLASLLALALLVAGAALPAAVAAPAVLAQQGAPAPEPPPISARGAVLWEPAGDVVLHGVAEDVGRPMASTTKIMTLLLALEAGVAADEVTVSTRAAAAGGASLGLRPGQRLPLESLLAGLLLRSGNDAAVALAEHVAGSEDAFVERMNARAAELGLVATRFVNASGLTDDLAHHASPLDLARLAHVAMQHPLFARWAGAQTAAVEGLPPMTTRNLLLGSYRGATGVKTGFTSLAGNCLVASATRDGRTLYAVVLGSEDSFADAAALLDHGFEAYRRAAPLAAAAPAARYRWADTHVDLVASAPLAATVPAGARVTWRTLLEPAAGRPVPAGAPLGTAELVVDGEVIGSVPLLTARAVPPPAAPSPGARVGVALQEALRTFVRLRAIEREA